MPGHGGGLAGGKPEAKETNHTRHVGAVLERGGRPICTPQPPPPPPLSSNSRCSSNGGVTPPPPVLLPHRPPPPPPHARGCRLRGPVGEGPLFRFAGTGKRVETPPQAQSLLFDEEGKAYTFTIGYTMDRRIGIRRARRGTAAVFRWSVLQLKIFQ